MWADVDTPSWWEKAALRRCGGGDGAGEDDAGGSGRRLPATDETAPLQDGPSQSAASRHSSMRAPVHSPLRRVAECLRI